MKFFNIAEELTTMDMPECKRDINAAHYLIEDYKDCEELTAETAEDICDVISCIYADLDELERVTAYMQEQLKELKAFMPKLYKVAETNEYIANCCLLNECAEIAMQKKLEKKIATSANNCCC